MERPKLLDRPNGQALVTAAMKAVRDTGTYPWYDAAFLRKFTAAKTFLQAVRPEAVERFVAAFQPLRTDRAFSVRAIADVLSPERLRDVRQVIADLSSDQLQTSSNSDYENEEFGRRLFRRHPYFNELGAEFTQLVGECVGEEVVPTYNFLSLYHKMGVCPPHLDEPQAKWTLDLCIDQNVEWPIHFSQVVPWPDQRPAEWTPDQVKRDPALTFDEYVLRPNNAILFSGSSQWHYRDPIAAGRDDAFCTLLFFHYTTAAAAPLAQPQNWAGALDLPELEVLALVWRTGWDSNPR